MESEQVKYQTYQIGLVENSQLTIIETGSVLSLSQNNGFTVLRGSNKKFQLIIMTKIQTLIIQQENLRLFIIQNDSKEQSYYSIVIDCNLNQNTQRLEQALNINGDLTYQNHNTPSDLTDTPEYPMTPEDLEQYKELQKSQVVIKPQINEKELSENQKTICKGADLVRDGLIFTGGVVGKVVIAGGKQVIKLIDKDKKEAQINPKLISMLGTIEFGSRQLYVAGKEALGYLSQKIGNKIKSQGEKDDGKINKIIEHDGIKTVVHVVSGVYDGLFQAADQVFIGIRRVAKEGVDKKYGREAGVVLDQGMGIVNNYKDIMAVHKHVISEQAYKQSRDVNYKQQQQPQKPY